jgi:uncharacterized protein (DUF2141 family)
MTRVSGSIRWGRHERRAWIAACALLIALASLATSLIGQLPELAQRTEPSPDPVRAATSLVVQVEGLRNTRGVLHVSLFRDREGFPERAELAAHSSSVPVTGENCEVRFEGVEPGEWAAAVLHDENENGRLDRNFLRIPREGVGASNDAGRAGSPKFEAARFEVPAEGRTVVVPLHYWM